jgi:hypothetical protein
VLTAALAADKDAGKTAPAASAGADVFSKSIGGKEWRVEKIAGSDKYKVTWGTKEVTWEPTGRTCRQVNYGLLTDRRGCQRLGLVVALVRDRFF